MPTLEVTSISTKGQVVIPSEIRLQLGLEPGSKLAVITDGTNVLLRPIESPRMADFSALLKESRTWARKAGLRPESVARAVKQVRRAHRS